MAKGPIQVVLNTEVFIQDVPPQKGGSSTDFYANRDSEFVQHKTELIEQLNNLSTIQSSSKYSRISYAKIKLEVDALAKSHRPTQKIFTTKNDCRIIGGGKVGEMLVELLPNSAHKIAREIANNAETITNWKLDKKTNKPKPYPSRWKSEVGAITTISPITKEDRVPFGLSTAIDWFNGKGKGSGYYVELFDIPEEERNWDILPIERRNLYRSFSYTLKNISGIKVFKTHIPKVRNLIYIRLTNDNRQIVEFQTPYIRLSKTENEDLNLDPEQHNRLLSFLAEHPLVKQVTLSPVIESIPIPSSSHGSTTVAIPHPSNLENFPKIGVIDSGVSGIYSEWIIDSWDNIDVTMRNSTHGTFITGLLVNGQLLNAPSICLEPDGCQIIDLCMLPQQSYFGLYYPRGLEDFIMELTVAIRELKSRTGVRIFNFSMNVESPRLNTDYGVLAKALDSIAELNDIVFIISAGNLRNNKRKEWDVDDEQLNIEELIKSQEIAFSPAESCRNISVGALNPTNMGLASYSRKGPATISGIKPDLVHIGGSGYNDPDMGYGLYSSSIDGNIVSDCGTSFSAPLVAKTMSVLEKSIQGTVSRETLMALTIHNTIVPPAFQSKAYFPLLKDTIGYGMPVSASDMINGNGHSISLVFANRIKKGKILSFSFNWPQCLMTDNKCKGHIRLTLVSTPQLDYTYGEELVRENVSVSLRQGDSLGQKKGQLKPLYEISTTEEHAYEKQLIEQTFKWSPVKVFERTFVKGIANKGAWFFEVEYLARDGVGINLEGVPFTAILTISDPKGEAPVYDQMRQNLRAIGVTISDIQTAARITQRI